MKDRTEVWKMAIVVAVVVASVLAFSLLFNAGDSNGTIPGIGLQDANPAALNQTNATVMGNAAFIMGYYPALDLYVTLPTNTAAPMITPFLLNVTSVGQAVASVYVGKSLYASDQFTGNAVIYDNASYSGTLNLTLKISTAAGTTVFTWLPNFMSPVTYISYEKGLTKSTAPGTSYEVDAALGVTIILSAVAFFKIFYPGAKARVRKTWIKEGPKRHV